MTRPMNTATCPHCNRRFATVALNNHMERCPEHPDVHAAILECLVGPNGETHGKAHYDQARLTRTADAQLIPKGDTLRMHYGGKWAEVCKAFCVPVPQETGDLAVMSKIAADVEADRQAMREYIDHQAVWGDALQVCRSRVLPDGRIAHLLR